MIPIAEMLKKYNHGVVKLFRTPQKLEVRSAGFSFPSPLPGALENHLGAFYTLILGIFKSGLMWSDLDFCTGEEAYGIEKLFSYHPNHLGKVYITGLCWGT